MSPATVAAVDLGASGGRVIAARVSRSGVELHEESRLANFTNEAGIDGTVRYLRNVTGLWLLQECQ